MQSKILAPGSAVAGLNAASGQQVRNKLLNMFGIEHPAAMSESSSTSEVDATSALPSTSRVYSGPAATSILKEALKYDRVADEKYSSPKRRKTDREHGSKQRKSLVFNESVDVLPIPMRTEYSSRVRSRIWSNAVEIHENATRNSIEFASEGWDWRSVKEDDQMYRCIVTNELLHPCWVNDASQNLSPLKPTP